MWLKSGCGVLRGPRSIASCRRYLPWPTTPIRRRRGISEGGSSKDSTGLSSTRGRYKPRWEPAGAVNRLGRGSLVRFALLALLGLLAGAGLCGCASKPAWTHYDECATQNLSFPDMVACGKARRTAYCEAHNNCIADGNAVVRKRKHNANGSSFGRLAPMFSVSLLLNKLRRWQRRLRRQRPATRLETA
jgi:hypothetical protein